MILIPSKKLKTYFFRYNTFLVQRNFAKSKRWEKKELKWGGIILKYLTGERPLGELIEAKET